MGAALGLGGGIILTPFILYMYPEMPPDQVTAISLFCISVNSTVGTIGYFRKKKVHLPTAILFSFASLPGAWFGVQLTHIVQRSKFELIFGIFLILIGAFLTLRKSRTQNSGEGWKPLRSRLIMGFFISFIIGTLASFLGIGGGIIHVPLMVEVIQFPVHMAVATSQFILATSAIVASIEHYLNGSLVFNSFALYIAAGILIGSPLGVRYSTRTKGTKIVKWIGVVVILVGARLIYANLSR